MPKYLNINQRYIKFGVRSMSKKMYNIISSPDYTIKDVQAIFFGVGGEVANVSSVGGIIEITK